MGAIYYRDEEYEAVATDLIRDGQPLTVWVALNNGFATREWHDENDEVVWEESLSEAEEERWYAKLHSDNEARDTRAPIVKALDKASAHIKRVFRVW